jgi:hypothetical protein
MMLVEANQVPERDVRDVPGESELGDPSREFPALLLGEYSIAVA